MSDLKKTLESEGVVYYQNRNYEIRIYDTFVVVESLKSGKIIQLDSCGIVTLWKDKAAKEKELIKNFHEE